MFYRNPFVHRQIMFRCRRPIPRRRGASQSRCILLRLRCRGRRTDLQCSWRTLFSKLATHPQVPLCLLHTRRTGLPLTGCLNSCASNVPGSCTLVKIDDGRPSAVSSSDKGRTRAQTMLSMDVLELGGCLGFAAGLTRSMSHW